MDPLQRILRAPWFPYVAPFVAFILLTYGGGHWPSAAHFWYLAKTVVVGAMLWSFRRHYPELRLGRSAVNWAIAILGGVVVLVVWVAPERLLAPLIMGDPTGFDPYSFGLGAGLTWAVIGVRLLGASQIAHDPTRGSRVAEHVD